MPRILILTASMGEGHNTAARNIRDALLAESGGKRGSSCCRSLYADKSRHQQADAEEATRRRSIVTRVRGKSSFELLSKRGVVEGMGPMLAELTAAVKALIDEFHPEIIASTYPVFSFLMAKIRKRTFIRHRAVLHCHHRLHDDQFGLVPLPLRWVDRGG